MDREGIWIVLVPAMLSSGILVQIANAAVSVWRRMRAEAQGRETEVQREQARTARVLLVLQRTRYIAVSYGAPLSELPALDDEVEVRALGADDD